MGCEGRDPELPKIMDRYGIDLVIPNMRSVNLIAFPSQGKAYEIKQIIHGRFYYPRGPGAFSPEELYIYIP